MKLTPEARTLILSAVAGLFANDVFAHDSIPTVGGQSERCYGIAKSGSNACSTAKHACSGLAKKDNEPDEWIEVPKGDCEKRGGKLAAPKG